MDDSIVQNILSNYKFYTHRLRNYDKGDHPQEQIQQLCTKFLRDQPGFSMSTPSIVQITSDEIIFNVRFVNYHITDNGEYVNKDKIVSQNVLYVLNKNDHSLKKHTLIQHNREHDGLYMGLEDMKLFSHKNKLHYICNRGINANEIQVEKGIIDENGLCDSTLLHMQEQKSIEKNWVLFDSVSKDDLYFVYNWHPLQIGKIVDRSEKDESRTYNSFIRHYYPTPRLFRHVRGSTNGVYIDNELWFLCHLVNYENMRYYYHLFVVLDPEKDFQLKRYSQLFTFEKHRVEYTTGFIYDEHKKRLLIGYSTNDNITKCMNIDKSAIDSLFIE